MSIKNYSNALIQETMENFLRNRYNPSVQNIVTYPDGRGSGFFLTGMWGGTKIANYVGVKEFSNPNESFTMKIEAAKISALQRFGAEHGAGMLNINYFIIDNVNGVDNFYIVDCELGTLQRYAADPGCEFFSDGKTKKDGTLHLNLGKGGSKVKQFGAFNQQHRREFTYMTGRL